MHAHPHRERLRGHQLGAGDRRRDDDVLRRSRDRRCPPNPRDLGRRVELRLADLRGHLPAGRGGRPVMRPLVWLATVVSVVAAALLVPVVGAAPSTAAQAAGMPPRYDPGNSSPTPSSTTPLADGRRRDPPVPRPSRAPSAGPRPGTPPCLKDYVTSDGHHGRRPVLRRAHGGCAQGARPRRSSPRSPSRAGSARGCCSSSWRRSRHWSRAARRQGLGSTRTPTGFGCPDTARLRRRRSRAS